MGKPPGWAEVTTVRLRAPLIAPLPAGPAIGDPAMTGGKGGCAVHQSKLDKCALLKEAPGVGAAPDSTIPPPARVPLKVEPLKLQDNMVAIQGVRPFLETRIVSVSIEVSLLRMDRRNMATEVKDVVESTATLQGVTKTLHVRVGTGG
ncbi:hypothetical protein NDU88_006964 [Pleurodeles waltl]|uniref:BON domain-containing protein n=1 Tax=Pleurodeles waltl TaxID=8319 RepID=A0AAV7N2G3_PLEWA|nr:hypothetical protein NDU88_006964 [Pleurodeles waltl]